MRKEQRQELSDPTYVKAEIDANPAWRRAWELSELFNDNAPIGWSNFIEQAEIDIAKAAEKPIIRIGYVGDRARNRGLDQAIAMLKLKHPGAEIVEVQIDPNAPGLPLDAFHTGPL